MNILLSDEITDTNTERPELRLEKARARRRALTTHALVAPVLLFLVLWLSLSPFVSMPFYNHMIFHPDTTDYPETGGILGLMQAKLKVRVEDVFYNSSDGTKVHAWFFALPSARKVVVVSHGNAGNISNRLYLALTLLQCGTSVLMYDYPGYGKSSGSPTIESARQSGIASYDYLAKERKIPGLNIIVYGESLGTGISCEIAKVRKVGGLVLVSGFASLLQAGREELPWLALYPDSWFDNYDNFQLVMKPHAPLLMMHGTIDQVLSYQNACKLFAAAVEPKKFVGFANANHNFESAPDLQKWSNELNQFFHSLPDNS